MGAYVIFHRLVENNYNSIIGHLPRIFWGDKKA